MTEKFRQKYNCKIIFEPGRAIVGNTAILVTKVQYLKVQIKHLHFKCWYE